MLSQHQPIKLTNRSNGIAKKKPTKTTHVPTACINCKKAHLACDLSRPCNRCSTLGKSDSCIDIKHKKRGRPKLNSVKKWPPTASSTTATLSSKPHAQHPSFSSLNAPALMPSRPNIPSSFKLTAMKECHINEEDRLPIELMTLFLSMDLCCARVSDESPQFLDMYPSELGHCSLYGLIHPESSETLSRLHRILLDNCHHHVTKPISFTPASSETFLTTSPTQLLTIANGSQTIRETLTFKAFGGSRLDCQFYLGGAFGGDVFAPTTLNQLYMVCVVSKNNNEANPSITSSSPLSVVESILANDVITSTEQQQDYQDLLNDPALLSLYNSTGASDNDTMQLVNHLCEAIMSPTSIDAPQSSTHYTTTNEYGGSSGSSSCGSIDDGSNNQRRKHQHKSSISSSRSSSISEQMMSIPMFDQKLPRYSPCNHYSQHTSALDNFMPSTTTSTHKSNPAPISEHVGDLLHDNNAYWLG